MPILKREIDLYPGHLFEAPAGSVPWTVAYVRSRQEKALARYLRGHDVPFYLPQYRKPVRSGGRERVSHLPLFPGYLFLPLSRRERRGAQKSNLVLHFLEVYDQERLHRELSDLWRLQKEGATLVPHPYLGPGDAVRITQGAFRGYTGKVLREEGRLRLVVSITLLRRSVLASFDREMLAPVSA